MLWTHTRLQNPIMTLQQLLKTFCEKRKFSCLFTLIHAQILYKLPQQRHENFHFSQNVLLRWTYFCTMRPFWRIFQRFCKFISKARMVTLWVSKSIPWLQRTSLGCFWTHQNNFWQFFMQGKSTFSRQKVDWKFEISDDPLEFIDFVRWRMGFLYWLVDIICWLCGYVKASPDFNKQVWSVFESIW